MRFLTSVVLGIALILGGCANKPFQEGRVYFGFYQTHPNDVKNGIKSIQKNLRFKPHIVAFRLDWEQPFPKRQIHAILKAGMIPLIVWEPWVWGDPDAIKLKNILEGEWDYIIVKWASEVKGIEFPVLIAFAPEFNNNDHPWSIGWNDQDPQLFIKSYRYVVEKFRQEGAKNALWVWTSANHSYPDAAWNDPLSAYPGDDVVDWVGIIGVNHGTAYEWSRWETFDDLFRPLIDRLSSAHPSKPVMIAGFGTVMRGGDIEAWTLAIPETLSSIKSVRAIVMLDKKEPVDLATNQPLFVRGLAKALDSPMFRANPEKINDVGRSE